MTSSKTPTLTPENQIEIYEFINSLVYFITGYHIQEFPEHTRTDTIEKVRSLYFEFITNYLLKSQNSKALLQFQFLQKKPDISLSQKFQDLEIELQVAHDEFVKKARIEINNMLSQTKTNTQTHD